VSAEERWRPVVGWEGLYDVSDRGRVRTVARTGVRRDGSRCPVPPRIRALIPNQRSGHLYVGLSDGGRVRQAKVHHLVLEAFVGPCPPGMQCCHFDDDPANNNIRNLRWDTGSANMLDRVRNGRHPMAQKTRCKNGHLFDEVNTGIGRRNGRIYRWCRQCNKDAKSRIGTACRRCAEGLPCEFPHGIGGHSYHGCRCEVCTQAKSAYDHERYLRRRDRPPGPTGRPRGRPNFTVEVARTTASVPGPLRLDELAEWELTG
jgi:hypothetical protein